MKIKGKVKKVKKMKKILFLLIILFTFQNVKALEINDDGIYINYNNIEMTQKEINNLINLGFTEKQISLMDEEEFNSNKNLQGEIVAQETKYYMTTITYSNSASTLSVKSSLPLKSETIEITEEEYNNSDDLIDNVSINGKSNGYVETNYKKMTTTIVKNGSNYRYKNDLVWKKMPSTRSYDIIGIGIDSTVSGISSSKYLKQIADISDSSTKTCYYQFSSSATWKQSSSGYAATFKLISNTSKKTVTALETYMYFNVQKLTENTIKVINAYGSYRHAQKKVESSVSNGVSIGTGGISFEASVSTSIKESYDSMSTAQATWSGISW